MGWWLEMVYLDIKNCNVCGAEQVDTTVMLTKDGYITVCRNCYKLIKGILKEIKDKENYDIKSIMANHINTKTDKYVDFFKWGNILKVLDLYSERKDLLESVINENPKGINVNKTEPYGRYGFEGRLKYEYYEGDVNDRKEYQYWNTNETEVDKGFP